MKVIVAGSRSITSSVLVVAAIINSEFYVEEIVSGTARGVDSIGEAWAHFASLPVTRFYPKWSTLGKSAGIHRNIEMGNYADALIAVWDGKSKGTKHMIDYMRSLNKPVYVEYAKTNT